MNHIPSASSSLAKWIWVLEEKSTFGFHQPPCITVSHCSGVVPTAGSDSPSWRPSLRSRTFGCGADYSDSLDPQGPFAFTSTCFLAISMECTRHRSPVHWMTLHSLFEVQEGFQVVSGQCESRCTLPERMPSVSPSCQVLEPKSLSRALVKEAHAVAGIQR